jgi:hypothetical protein
MSLIGSSGRVFAPISIQRGWGVWATHTDPEDLESYNRVGFAKSRGGAVAIVRRLSGRPVTGMFKVSDGQKDMQPWRVGSRGFGGEAYEMRGSPSFRIEHGDWDAKWNPGLRYLSEWRREARAFAKERAFMGSQR